MGLADPSLADPWARAQLALRLLALNPGGLGGIHLTARAGPVRDIWLDGLTQLPRPVRKLHPSMADDALFGGVDVAATLAAGTTRRNVGLLAEPATLLLPMAERCDPALAARLAQCLDKAEGHCLIALDESASEDEALPAALSSRIAFAVDLTDVGYHAATADFTPLGSPRKVIIPQEALAQITILALKLGITCLRATLFAAHAAKANAALSGRDRVEACDIQTAAALVLAPRATQFPAEEPQTDDTPPPPQETAPDDPQDDPQGEAPSQTHLPDELLLEAVAAALPPDVLARLAAQKSQRAAKGAGAGSARVSNRKGRPLPARAGRMDGRSRIDLVATLRNAAPWQRHRKSQATRPRPIHIQTSDIRLKRYQEMSDRLLIFAVDASGSAAFARLAEAKGAIEMLLAQAYARRDHVSLVSFRAEGAECLLPPTRSLVQTKRRLAALPGGGGTPLAAGLKTALEQALVAKTKGLSPTVILLTDGRANITLSGEANRPEAARDATTLAQQIWAQGVPSLVIDVSKRPERSLQTLSQVMDAPYIPLPRANAEAVSQAITAALD